MELLNDKVDGSGGAQGNLPAAQWNQVPSELQNIITALGQTLSNADLNQVGKAIAGYVANGNFYSDGGAANAYVLSPIGGKQTAPAYSDGMVIQFNAANANTGASTVNVNSLGVKDIKTSTGDDPTGGTISGRTSCYFDAGNDWFVLNEGDGLRSLRVDDTLSGSDYTLSSIPSWASKIVIAISEASGTVTAAPRIRLGDSGGIETTDYRSYVYRMEETGGDAYLAETTYAGLIAGNQVPSERLNSVITLVKTSGNTWVWTGTGNDDGIGGASNMFTNTGKKELSDVLTDVEFSLDSGNFDNGGISILVTG